MNAEFIVPFLVLSIPIVAIIGGIVAGIVRSAGQQRMLELAQRERIAAIERGLDPSKLPAIPQVAMEIGSLGSSEESAKRRAQSLMIGGLVTSFGGAGLLVFLILVEIEKNFWAAGLIPIMVGVALLISAALVWPRNGAPRA